MHLDAVAVELDLVDPALAAWRFVDRSRSVGSMKPGKGRLGPDRRGLLSLECHGSQQADWKPQLDVVITTFIAISEVLQEERDVTALSVAPPA
jgi:hypothetical protein